VKTDELLRRLALNDDRIVGRAISAASSPGTPALDPKTAALVRLAALLALGAETVSCRAAADVARAHGASDEEMVGVLLAVGPAVGAARLVMAAPRLALAIDYDVASLDAVSDHQM
jgi:4-carboxymuconolactone decarboxylase